MLWSREEKEEGGLKSKEVMSDSNLLPPYGLLQIPALPGWTWCDRSVWYLLNSKCGKIQDADKNVRCVRIIRKCKSEKSL
mmetsp:Transcript_85721/g.171606  ORF Transcript_85721/g.171606 Transcript_85721/m.171606 type:complete len:80 (-) Transcript_85721:137-376(-)